MIAAVTVAAVSGLSGVQFHADAQGTATLAWEGYRGDRFQIRTVDVRDGRPAAPQTVLWDGGEISSAELSDADVSPNGQAVACMRDRVNSFRQTWKLRIIRRAPGQPWSKPVLVTDPHQWIEEISCAVSDSGHVALAWATISKRATRFSVYATTVAPDGTVAPPVLLAARGFGHQALIGPDGKATVAFTPDTKDRTLQLAERPPGGQWATRSVPGFSGARLAIDGAGVISLGLDGTPELGRYLQVASAPSFAPAPLTTEEPGSALDALVAGPRGDLLATWVTRRSRLNVSLRRPGGTFAPPVALGRVHRYFSGATTALAADGSGAVSWTSPRGPFTRVLSSDGHWRAPVSGGGLLVAAPGGRVTAAWTEQRRRGGEVLRVGPVE